MCGKVVFVAGIITALSMNLRVKQLREKWREVFWKVMLNILKSGFIMTKDTASQMQVKHRERKQK